MSDSISLNSSTPISDNKRRRSISIDLSQFNANIKTLSSIPISPKPNSTRARKPKRYFKKKKNNIKQLNDIQLNNNQLTIGKYPFLSLPATNTPKQRKNAKNSIKKSRSNSISMKSIFFCNEEINNKSPNRRHSDNDYQRKKIKKLRKQNKCLKEQCDHYRDENMLLQIEKKQFEKLLNSKKNEKQTIHKLEKELELIKKQRVEEKRKLQEQINNLTKELENEYDENMETTNTIIEESKKEINELTKKK
eukprot:187919_1